MDKLAINLSHIANVPKLEFLVQVYIDDPDPAFRTLHKHPARISMLFLNSSIEIKPKLIVGADKFTLLYQGAKKLQLAINGSVSSIDLSKVLTFDIGHQLCSVQKYSTFEQSNPTKLTTSQSQMGLVTNPSSKT